MVRGLKEIAQSVISSPKIYTKKRMEEENEQKVMAQERDEKALKDAFKTNEREANEAKSAEEQFKKNMEILEEYVPEKLLKRDPVLVEKMKLQVLERYPTINDAAGNCLSELLANDHQNGLIAGNLKQAGYSEEKIQEILEDKEIKDHVDRVLGPNSKVGREAITKLKGAKSTVGGGKKLFAVKEKTTDDRDRYLLEKSISESEKFIEYFTNLLKDEPENEDYRDALKKFQEDRAKVEETLHEITEEKSKKDLFLDEAKGIKNTYGRREEISQKYSNHRAKYAELKKQFIKEEDPTKKMQLKAECVRINKLMASEQNSLLFERLYGEEMDAEVADAKDPKEVKAKIDNYKVFQKRKELSNMSLTIGKLRKRLENPNITKEERIEILKAISMTEKSGINNLELFGVSPSRSQNLVQRIGAISSEELYELKKNRIMNMRDGAVKDVHTRILEANKRAVDGFGNAISSLREKGFSNRDIQILLDGIQIVRNEKGTTYMTGKDDESYAKLIDSFLVSTGTSQKEGIGKAFVQEFMAQGMGKKDLSVILEYNDELAIKAISEQREFAIKEKDRLGEVKSNQEIKKSLRSATSKTRESEIEQERKDIVNGIKIMGIDFDDKTSSDQELSEV